ncbi:MULTISPECIES: lycopene cyclase family protein [unclassified Gordonia (in: high G+C Gram-positive bacteria)]
MSSTSVIVVGAGPSGRALSHRLLHHGVAVTLIDPAPHRRWTPTYAAWTDELPTWVGGDMVAARVDSVSVYAYRRRDIARGYTVFDTQRLQNGLSIDDAHVVDAKAVEVQTHSVITDDGESITADHVIDCRGTSARHLPRQTAYGVIVGDDDARRVLDGSPAILMDWRAPEHTAPWQHGGPSPSFLYAVPLGADTVLLEETCLVGRPALRIRELRDRLARRLAAYGLADARLRGSETVAFPMLPDTRTPWETTPLTFGAAGGLLNPISGYGVATALRCADLLARGIRDGDDPTELLWPFSARQVWRLRLRGLGVLLGLDPAQTVTFFAAFLALPVSAQRSYLSERTDLAGALAAMRSVFAALDHRTRLRLMREVTRPGLG